MSASFGWMLLAMGLWGGLHSLLASLEAKALAERWFGRPALRRAYRLAYNLFAVVSFVPVLALAALLPDRPLYTVPAPGSLALRIVQAAAALGVVYAASLTGLANLAGLEQLLNPASEDRPRPLATAGLYRFVRHPIYTCAIVFLWASPSLSWNGLAFNLGATLYFGIGAWFEERKLVREFGEAYVQYRRRTPMLMPGLKGRGR